MQALQDILRAALGQFVCEDGGIYRGQCPQLPKYMARACGMDWPDPTGNGNTLVDRVVELGGYYGESKYGYRICSCTVNGNKWGHTWVEILVDGQWRIYEQNVGRDGLQPRDFGCGPTYPVSTATERGSWRQNIRYAGHPAIDAFIEAHPDKEPEPTPEPSEEFQVGDKVDLKYPVDIYGTALIPELCKNCTIAQMGNGLSALVNSADGDVLAWVGLSNLVKIGNETPVSGFAVGDLVIPTRLVDYDGTPLRQYDPVYTITEINGDRAVLSARGQVWAAMNTADIRKA